MYQVLARKYRPRNFNELVGQNHVSRALTSALDRGRLHHAYLFTGTRGVGKTTIARILAKCLNCETGITSTPCEVCATCKAVNEGRFIDLIEIDAASRTKVEDTRELLDNVPYAPTQGRFKVYLIDEVHMLSTHSFNALLKTLEEPPEHVKFLFATTDPQKLPITVISRCLQFTLRPLAVDEITHHLDDILDKEQIQAEQDAIWQIAESAQGSLRDALSLTDQAIAYGQGEIHHQDVKEMLGLIDRTIIYDLILAIHQNQHQRVSELLLQFRQQALDVSLVLDQFISTLHELAILQYLPDLSLKYSAEINKKIMLLSQIVSGQDLQLYYQIACKGRIELQLAVTQEQGFEMTILRLLAFRPLQVNELSIPQQQIQQNIENVVVQGSIKQNLSQIDSVNTKANPNQSILENTDLQSAHLKHIEAKTSDGITNHTETGFEPASEYIKDELSQPHIDINEPNSDDYLDSEESLINSKIQVQDLGKKSSDLNLEQVSQQSITENLIQTEIVESIEPSLTSFGGEMISSEFSVQSSKCIETDQDIFFLAPENQKSPLDSRSDSLSIRNNSDHQENVPKSDLSLTVDVKIIAESVNADIKPQDSLSNQQQTPQEILTLQTQKLEGEWTVDKWEYWFRNSAFHQQCKSLPNMV